MAPFITLIFTFTLLYTAGWLGWSYMAQLQHALQGAVAAMFLLTASAHWGKRRPDLIRMVPAIFPRPDWLVSATGLLEIIGAVLLVIPFTSSAASIGLAIMLLAMFPANIRASREKLRLAGKEVMPIKARTLIQIVFLLAVILAGI
ncbi:DoxX family protein [Bacillus gobiensis]|uniref:DoxX family protein n=1 Tax=Bacillus gobiensis TaxID=1441095 RepID=UPI003D24CD9A